VPARRVLFVCRGNTCRSPLAAGLAAQRHGQALAAASAGTAAKPGAQAAHDALAAGAEEGLDLTAHSARSLDEVDLAAFDRIVALDPAVGEALRARPGLRKGALEVWDVPDPWGKGLPAYRSTIARLRELVDGLVDD
jgi:protein-tyrosine-phosphatase